MKTSDVVGLCAAFCVFGWAIGLMTNADIPYWADYVDVKCKMSEELSRDNVFFYIQLLESRISRAKVALDQGLPAYEVAKILHG